MRRTKIVCTIGPATESAEMIGRLIDAGMNVARLNFAHNTHDWHAERIREIRRLAEERDRRAGVVGAAGLAQSISPARPASTQPS